MTDPIVLPGMRKKLLGEFFKPEGIAQDIFDHLKRRDTQSAAAAWRRVANRVDSYLSSQETTLPVRRAVISELCDAVRVEISRLRRGQPSFTADDTSRIVPFRPRSGAR